MGDPKNKRVHVRWLRRLVARETLERHWVMNFKDDAHMKTTVNFDAVFGPLASLDVGKVVADPMDELSPQEMRDYREGLEDVVRAQRHAETLGSLPRR